MIGLSRTAQQRVIAGPAFVRTEIVPNTYQSGEYAIPEFAIPSGIECICVRSPCTGWPVTTNTVMVCEVSVSYDGGITWPFTMSWTVPGIPATGPDGQPVRQTSGVVTLAQPTSSQRRFRASMQPLVSLPTSLEMEAGVGNL